MKNIHNFMKNILYLLSTMLIVVSSFEKSRAEEIVTITSSGPLTFCPGDSVTLCAEICPGCVAPYTFLWMLNDTVVVDSAQCIKVKNSGAYCVKVTCGSGCKVTKCVRVTVGFPYYQAVASAPSCRGLTDGKITVRSLVYPSCRLYQLIPGNSCHTDQFQYQESNVFTGLSAGNYHIRVLDLCNDCDTCLYVTLLQGNDCCMTPPDSMVAWWPMDETTGNKEKDLMGYNNVATCVKSGSPIYSTGKVAGCLWFNSYADNFALSYLDVDNHPELNFGEGDFSIDAWIKPEDYEDLDGKQIIVDKTITAQNGRLGYTLFLNKHRLAFELADNNGINSVYTCFNPELCMKKWHHVAVTVDRDNINGIVFYVDGVVSCKMNPTYHQGNIFNTGGLRIACASDFIGDLFYGLIDEVELFNRVLTANEISDIFYSQEYGKCKPLLEVNITSLYPDYGVPVQVSPPDDNNMAGDGITSTPSIFKRYYYTGSTVSLTAPAKMSYYVHFKEWRKNHLHYSYNQTITPTITEDVEYTALYESIIPPDNEPYVMLPTAVSCTGECIVSVRLKNIQYVASMSMIFGFDTTAIHFIGYQDVNPVLDDAVFFVNASEGKIFFACYSIQPFSIDSGRLISFNFFSQGGFSTLHWDSIPGHTEITGFDEIPIPADFIDGSLMVVPCSTLEGTLTYDNQDHSPLINTTVQLKQGGEVISTSQTNILGKYWFPQVLEGNYTLESYSDNPVRGINAIDAQRILMAFAHYLFFSPLRSKAADVNASGYFNANHALGVTRLFVGITSSFLAG
ncbi:MAG: hypothetical protein NTU44_02505, partial [Bacteroidetes bacterium]|nr:hypothetical protein [Bacteroidota bacterium]